MQRNTTRNAWWPSKLLGPVFVGLAYVLIACIAYVHFRVLLPLAVTTAADSEAASLDSAVHHCVSVFLLVELLAQYSLAVWTDPGYVHHSIDAVEAAHDKSSGGGYNAANELCKKCAGVKPRRAHHCRECARCVHEMDHHCPWINNCVGYNNHRFFWLVLFYLWVCCAYVSILASEPFFKVLRARKQRPALSLPLEDRVYNVAISFSFLLTTSLGLVLFGYWLWHSFLALTQQTTIEFAGRLKDQESDNHRGAVTETPPGNPRCSRNLRVRNLQRMLRRNDRFWLLALVLPPLPPTMMKAAAHHLIANPKDEDSKRWSV